MSLAPFSPHDQTHHILMTVAKRRSVGRRIAPLPRPVPISRLTHTQLLTYTDRRHVTLCFDPPDTGRMKRVIVRFSFLLHTHTHKHTSARHRELAEFRGVQMCILIKLFCVAQTCLWLMCKLGGGGPLLLSDSHTDTHRHTKPPVLLPCILCEASVKPETFQRFSAVFCII